MGDCAARVGELWDLVRQHPNPQAASIAPFADPFAFDPYRVLATDRKQPFDQSLRPSLKARVWNDCQLFTDQVLQAKAIL